MKNRIHDNPYFKTGSSSKNFAKKPGTRTVAEVTLKSGGKIPLHYHFEFSEYYEVLEGELKMQVGKEIKTCIKVNTCLSRSKQFTGILMKVVMM
jgi:mannose-6-phosphate isomerase-like protein (cupin superfamily)